MSAALSSDWGVGEHEPSVADDAAQHAQVAAGHGMMAMQAAQDAHRSHEASRIMHEGAAQHLMDMMAQALSMRAEAAQNAVLAAEDRRSAEAAAQHAMACSQAAGEHLAQAAAMLDATHQLAASFAQMVDVFRAPRKIVVTQRGADGAISEAVSSTEG